MVLYIVFVIHYKCLFSNVLLTGGCVMDGMTVRMAGMKATLVKVSRFQIKFLTIKRYFEKRLDVSTTCNGGSSLLNYNV